MYQDATFGVSNKEAFEGVIKFLNVMASGTKLPDRLKIDAEHVCLILTADTAEIAEVSKAALVIDGIKRSQEQILLFGLWQDRLVKTCNLQSVDMIQMTHLLAS